MSSLNALPLSPLASVTQDAQLDANFAYRGKPAVITNAYERATGLASRVVKNVKESTVSKMLQKPGIYVPVATGVAVTAGVTALSPVSMALADVALWSMGSKICSTSPEATVSGLAVIGGLVGTAVGMVAPGELATDRNKVHPAIAGCLAGVGSFVGQLATLVSHDGPLSKHDDSLLCTFAELPGMNVICFGGVGGLVGVVTGIAALQGYKFCRSAAQQADEERGYGEM